MGNFGEWIGDPSSLDFIEGFSINVPEGIESTDLSYQALLGNGWDSPWIKSGEFCGSRGLALGLLGLRIRLTGRSAQRYKLTYSAMFSGGKLIGPIKNNNECLCDQSQTMVAFKVVLVPKSHQ